MQENNTQLLEWNILTEQPRQLQKLLGKRFWIKRGILNETRICQRSKRNNKICNQEI